MESLSIDPGSLLAAWPDLRDPNFMHRVVVICQHQREGAFGFVVNQRTEYLTSDLLDQHPDLGTADLPVFWGGPVGHDSIQFLHCVPDEVPGGTSLDGELWYGGDLHALGRYAVERPEEARKKVRMFLGYSGWDAGQLDNELSTGSWMIAAGAPEFIFGETGEVVWRNVMRSVGEEGKSLENLPPDVSWN